MRELLMDTEADASSIASYISTVENATATLGDKLESGEITNEEYGNFDGYNLTLSDTIGVSFYGSFSNTPDNSVVILEYADGKTETVDIDELDTDSSGRKILNFNLNASQMTDEISVSVVFDNESCTEEIVTSVRKYADTILADEKYEQENPGINELVKAMLNYGAYAQQYFNYNVENLANEGIYTDSDNPVVNGDFSEAIAQNPEREGAVNGLVPAGWTLALESDIIVRFYFATDNIHKYNFSVLKPGGSSYELEAEYYENGVYRISVLTDDASLIDDKYYLNITNVEDGTALTVEFSAMMYVDTILSGSVSSTDALYKLTAAIKLYCNSANNYNGN